MSSVVANTRGVANKIAEHLWLGDLESSSKLPFLAEAKIRLIVRLYDPRSSVMIDSAEQVYLHRNPTTIYNYNKMGITEMRWSIEDDPSPESRERMLETVLPEALQLIRTFTEKGQAVLVHCNAGYSRAPTVVAAWLIQQEMSSSPQTELQSPSWWVETALTCIRLVRDVKPNDGFHKALLHFAASRARALKKTGPDASVSLSLVQLP